MCKNKTAKRDALAIDALLAATCRTGALDPDVDATEAESMGDSVRPLARQEQAAFAACGGDVIAALRRRMKAAERRRGLGFVPALQEPVYAAGISQERDAARSMEKLRRARKRMKDFLGE